MKRGFFSVPGLFFVFIAAMVYFALFPAFSTIIGIALPMVDGYTQLVLSLILPTLVVGLLWGYYRSIVSPERDYRG